MAAESRLSRRQLTHALLDPRSPSSLRKAFARMVLSNTFPDAAYIFLAESKPENQTYEEYRKYRVARLLAYCKVAILRATDAKHIVGVAFDSIDPTGKVEVKI
ncbi:MAG TPA: hypothetical protein VFH21_06200 [Burkholderiales bacterium]|nr:hypothetical protein [Burkholderiales bacterium]